MALNSTYALTVFYVVVAIFVTFYFLLSVVVLWLFFCKPRSFDARYTAMAIALLIVTLQMLFTFFMATFSAFGFLEPAVSFAVAAFLWIPALAVYMTLSGGAWRTAFLVVSSGDTNDADLAEGGLSQYHVCRGFITFVKAGVLSSMKRPFLFSFLSFFAFLYTFLLIFVTVGVCYCSQPWEITTWASRRSDPHYCELGQFCHLYTTLGRDCGRLRAVGQIVVGDGSPVPIGFTARLCEVDDVVEYRACSTHVAPRQITGTVFPYKHIAEDIRYIGHIFLGDLRGSTVYRLDATFSLSSSYNTSKTITFRTVPCEDSDETVHFIGGGDINQEEKTVLTLISGISAIPSPMFFFIGGDLTNANNMRTCYLRWDRMLRLYTSIRTREGYSLPFLTIPGNHEGGGFLVEPSMDEYNFYIPYFPQYDDDNPADVHTTHHYHLIGKRLLMIGLDAGIMLPLSTERAYLEATLKRFENASKFTIVMNHVPMYPSTRARDDENTVMCRDYLESALDQYKVPLVLEFHDHAYKRTFPMKDGKRNDADGTVHIGDGGLGAYESSRPITWKDDYMFKRQRLRLHQHDCCVSECNSNRRSVRSRQGSARSCRPQHPVTKKEPPFRHPTPAADGVE